MPHMAYDESAGVEAISILVDKWFAENTFHADEFNQLRELVDLEETTGIDHQPGTARVERRTNCWQGDQNDEEGIDAANTAAG